MHSSLPFRLIATALLSLSVLAATAYAGGSLDRAEFLSKIADESIRRYVIDHFELAEEGRALRVGRHLPNAGERIAPFEILATSTRENGSETLVIRLDSPQARQITLMPCSESAHYDSKCE